MPPQTNFPFFNPKSSKTSSNVHIFSSETSKSISEHPSTPSPFISKIRGNGKQNLEFGDQNMTGHVTRSSNLIGWQTLSSAERVESLSILKSDWLEESQLSFPPKFKRLKLWKSQKEPRNLSKMDFLWISTNFHEFSDVPKPKTKQVCTVELKFSQKNATLGSMLLNFSDRTRTG